MVTIRQFLMLVAISTVTMVLLLAAGLYLSAHKPEWLGRRTAATGEAAEATQPTLLELELDRLRMNQRTAESTVRRLRDSVGHLTTTVAQLQLQLNELRQQLATAEAKLGALQQAARRDSLRLKNLQTLADMYNRADPAEVAKILEGANSKYAATVLRLMKPRVAAKVLEALPKDKALAISQAATDLL